MKVGDFQYDFGASFRRVTPSTQVGRLSGPHFELDFQLDSIATMGRMAMERKGAGVSKTVLLNNVSENAQVKVAFSSCKAVGNGLGEVS